MDDDYKYKAFISYSHADEELAKWLHGALETYRVPKRLVGREGEYGPAPPRLSPVFRDREELSTATSLGETLTRALQQSQFQIVICSRAAARSRWVNEEILTFKRLCRERRILALVIDGEPGASTKPETAELECFPPALIYRVGPDGELTEERSEPIAADLRPGKDSKQDARLKIVAGMLDVGLDELKQRDARRRHVRMMWLVGGSLAGMIITSALAAVAWLARDEAERQRVRAEEEAETAMQTTRFMVDLFKVSDPSEALGNTITAREILDRGAERIQADLADRPAIQATLMDTMGTVYTSLGLYDQAERLMRDAVGNRQELFGNEHAEVASSLSHLGELLMLKGELTEAEVNLRSSLGMRQRIHGRNSAEAAEALMLLADVVTRQGRYEEAEPLIQDALGIQRDVYGAEHPDVAASIEALGLNYFDRGDYQRAIPELRVALKMRRELHPQGHPRLAQSMSNLGWALQNVGRVQEAEELQREALDMKRRLYGASHPEIAASLTNVAYTLELSGNYAAARSAYIEALDMQRRLLGNEHPATVSTLESLAYVVDHEGNRELAINMLRDVREIRLLTTGPSNPGVTGAGLGLAYWLTETGQYEEAERLVNESLEIVRTVRGPEHPATGAALTVRANLLLATGRIEEARAVAVEAQRIIRLNLPDESWQTAAARSVEGAALAKLGQYERGEELLLGSLEPLADAPIPGLQDSGRSRLRDLYVAWGRPEDAARYRETTRSQP